MTMPPEKILLAEPRGFCSGVRRALEMVDQVLAGGQAAPPVCILHEIVHNEHVVNGLKSRGIRIIETPEEAPPEGTLILSAHGVSAEVEARSRRACLTVIDATCPLVKAVHRRAAALSESGFVILLFGKHGHREVEGILGRIKGESHLIETPEEACAFRPDPGKRYACLSQTTLNAGEIADMTAILKEKIPDLLAGANVCHATEERQEAVRRLASVCDAVIVIGSEKSSNSRRLAELVSAAGKRSVLIPCASALDPAFLDGVKTLGIASGASAPEELMEELLGELRKLPVSSGERTPQSLTGSDRSLKRV